MKRKKDIVAPLSNRTSPNGNIRTDRLVKWLPSGRLQLSLKTSDADEAAERNAMLTKLIGEESVVILELAGKRLNIDLLWSWWQKSGGIVRKVEACFAAHTAKGGSATVQSTQEVAAVATEALQNGIIRIADRPELMPLGELNAKTAAAYERHFWKAMFDSTDDLLNSEAGPETRARYDVALRTFKGIIEVVRLEAPVIMALNALSDDAQTALDHVRRRGIPLKQAFAAAWQTKPQRSADPNFAASRLGHRYATYLRQVPRELADQLTARLEYGPRLETVRALGALMSGRGLEEFRFGAEAKPRKILEDLRYLASVLEPSARLVNLLQLKRVHWEALQLVWRSSGTDWMQMRRALSARSTCMVGQAKDSLRQRIIDAIPTAEEVERELDLSAAQFLAILGELPEYARAVVVTLAVTGLRRKEFFRLSQEHLDHNTYKIRVPGTKTKNSPGVVHVSPQYWDYVVEAIPAVFGPSKLRDLLQGACETLGLHPIRIHDLRHCAGTFAARGGADLYTIATHLRHATVEMAKRYTEAPKKELAANAVAGTLGTVHASSRSEAATAQPHAGSSRLNAMNREALYDLVWSKPVYTLTEEMGISGVALRMRCEKQGIPTPPRGYWQKLAKKKHAERTPLSPR